jgi:small subunit ribosomal protein S5
MNRLGGATQIPWRTQLRRLAPQTLSRSTRFTSSITSTTASTNNQHDEANGGTKQLDRGLESFSMDDGEDYPNLLQFDPLMDLHDSITFQPTKKFPYPAKVTVRNDPSMFVVANELAAFGKDEFDGEGEEEESVNPEGEEEPEGPNPMAALPLSSKQIKALHKYPILTRRVTQQTGKGKIHRMYAMMIVGNGDGLVGMGEGKADELPEAQSKALVQAVRDMDYVERFENRTIFTEMSTKLGSTRVIMRPRPVGFGLHCNPNIHQILKAAGIKDISAKVWGSRNKINVIKACLRMVQAGHAPTMMGDGIGGGARKLNKGGGIMGREEMERARGRKLVDIRI